MKTITPRFLPASIGAIVGGTLLEQDNDAFGLSLGLGIGALVGHNFKVTLPDSNKLVYRDQVIALPEVRLSELDSRKLELLNIAENLSREELEKLPGQLGAQYDYMDIYGTLHAGNIKEAIKGASDIEEIRRLKIATLNPEKFSLVANPEMLPNNGIRFNPKVIINLKDGEGELEDAMNIIKHKFMAMGYSGEELDSKLVIFKSAIADVDRVILDEQSDRITVFKDGEKTEFRVSSSHQEGISSYMDTNNYYSVRSINPNAKNLVRDPQLAESTIANPDALAEEMGIKNPDQQTPHSLSNVQEDGLKIMNSMHLDASKFSPEELRILSKYLGENKFSGYAPDDLKALLYASPLYEQNREVFDTWLDSAYQHRQEESAFRAAGYNRKYISEEVADDLTKRLSGQQDFGRSFNLDDSGKIDVSDPLRDISYKGYNGEISEHRQFLEMLRDMYRGVDDGKKADHNNIATNARQEYVEPYNINAPMERNPFTQSREVRTENLGKNSIANTFEILKTSGQIPSEYGSAIVARRVSVDEKRFNRDVKKYGGFSSDFNALSDGGSIGSAGILGNYNTTGSRTYKVLPNADGILELSDKVTDLLEKRKEYGINQHHTEISFGRYERKIERAKDKRYELSKKIRELHRPNLPIDRIDTNFPITNTIDIGERVKRVQKANERYLQHHPDAKDRPTDYAEIRKKIEHDYQRGVSAKEIGYATSLTKREKEVRRRAKQEAKLERRREAALQDIKQTYRDFAQVLESKLEREGHSQYVQDLIGLTNEFADDPSVWKRHGDLGDHVDKFNEVLNATFKPGEIIGIAGNGEAVKLTDEFHTYKFKSVTMSNANTKGDAYKANFVFQGISNIGDMGSIKTFAVDHKQNIAITPDTVYGFAQAQAIFNSIFEPVEGVEGDGADWVGRHSVVANIDGTPSEIHKFRNRETGETVFFSDRKITDIIQDTQTTLRLSDERRRIGATAVISSISNNGQEIAERVANALIHSPDPIGDLMALKAGAKTKNSINEAVAGTVVSLARVTDKGFVKGSEAWALGQMTQALTEGKASMNALLGMKILGYDRLKRDLEFATSAIAKVSDPERKGVLSSLEKDRLKTLITGADTLFSRGYIINRASSMAHLYRDADNLTFGAAVKEAVLQDYLERVNQLESHFGSAGTLAKFIHEGGIDDEMADMFRYAYENYGESLMIASPDASQGYATGSGKQGKTMSHIAQTQLLAAGMSKETLSMFGDLDHKDLYDYKALTTLDADMEGKPTLNTLLDAMVYDSEGNFSKPGYHRANALVRRLAAAEPSEVRDILKTSGVGDEILNPILQGEYLRLTLPENQYNMTNLPIYMEDTSRNGTYISEDERRTTKPLQRAQNELLQSAYEHLYTPSGAGPALSTVEELAKDYIKVWHGMVGNTNNPMLKDVLARFMPNSSYSKVMATSNDRLGELVRLSLQEGNEYSGRSFAGISKQKAARLVQNYYGDALRITTLDPASVAIDQMSGKLPHNVRSIDDFIGADGILRVHTEDFDMVPLPTLINREPSHSSYSVSPYELMVFSDREIGYSKNSLDSVFIHVDDQHYTSLMVGDFDNDHVLMYSAHKMITSDEYASFKDYAQKIASVRNDLVPLMKALSVKGSDHNHPGIYDVTSSMQELEDNIMKYKPAGMTVEEYRGSDAYWEEVSEIADRRRGNAVVKGGIRKTLSAPVVQLSVHLANAVHTSSSLNQDFLTHAVAKTLNHALVENIIKTQHISTDNLPANLPVEKIFQLRDGLSKGRAGVKVEDYRKELRKFFTEMVDVARNSTDIDPISGLTRGAQVRELEAKLFQNNTDFKHIINDIIETDIRNMNDPRYAPTSILEYSKVAARVKDEGYDASLLAELTRDMGSKIHGDQLSLLDFSSEESPKNIKKSVEFGTEELLKVLKQNLTENQKTLMIGGALLGVGAVISQKDPDFSAHKSIRADTQAGSMAPSMVANMQTRDADLQTTARDRSEYIRPGRGLDRVKQNYSVDARYSGQEGREAVGAKEAIFGKNITNVNINMNNSY